MLPPGMCSMQVGCFRSAVLSVSLPSPHSTLHVFLNMIKSSFSGHFYNKCVLRNPQTAEPLVIKASVVLVVSRQTW